MPVSASRSPSASLSPSASRSPSSSASSTTSTLAPVKDDWDPILESNIHEGLGDFTFGV